MEDAMPEFEKVNGWSIVTYLNDHLPIHVHAKKAGISVRIFLDGQCDVEHHGKLAVAERRMLIEFVKNHAAQIEGTLPGFAHGGVGDRGTLRTALQPVRILPLLPDLRTGERSVRRLFPGVAGRADRLRVGAAAPSGKRGRTGPAGQVAGVSGKDASESRATSGGVPSRTCQVLAESGGGAAEWGAWRQTAQKARYRSRVILKKRLTASTTSALA